MVRCRPVQLLGWQFGLTRPRHYHQTMHLNPSYGMLLRPLQVIATFVSGPRLHACMLVPEFEHPQ